jgi:hypothetical protein
MLASEESVVSYQKVKRSPDDSLRMDRVAAERTQIYERLSLTSINCAEGMSTIFSSFSIPLAVKKKKVFLTASLCK